jgi:hypothetical protein
VISVQTITRIKRRIAKNGAGFQEEGKNNTKARTEYRIKRSE